MKKIRNVLAFALCIVLLTATLSYGSDSQDKQNNQTSSVEVNESNLGSTTPESVEAKTDTEPSESAIDDKASESLIDDSQKKPASKSNIKPMSLFDGTLEVAGITGGNIRDRVEAAFSDLSISDPESEYENIEKLVLNGTLTSDDYTFIRENMSSTLIEVDLSGITNTKIPSRAFSECTALKKINLDNIIEVQGGIESDADSGAFTGCTSLEDLGDTSNLTKVGHYAFKNCFQIRTANISNITSFGWHSFYDCNKMDVTVDMSNAESIGRGAFWDCTNLKGQLDMASLTRLEEGAFKGTSITKVKDFGSVDVIVQSVFMECKTLIDVDLSKIKEVQGGITSNVNSGAFLNCTGLENVGNTANLISVGNYAFKNCSSLKTIDITNVKTFGVQAFYNCSAMDVTVDMSNAETIGNSTFFDCINLKGQLNMTSLKKLDDGAFKGTSVTKVIDFGSITAIGQSVFRECKSLVDVDLSKITEVKGGITSNANSGAFLNCTALENVGNTSKLTAVGNYAFRNCSKLKTIDISNVTTFGWNAFDSCIEMDVTLDMSKAVSIGRGAFSDCINFKGALNMTSLKKLEASAFKGTTVTEVIDFGSVNVLEDSVFRECRSLIKVDLRNIKEVKGGITSNINSGSFGSCTALKELGDTSGISNVGNYAFRNCSAIEKINLTSVNSFGWGSFTNCSSLEVVDFPKDATYASNTFFGCALDMSESNPTKGYPKGTYPSDNPLNSFKGQNPRVYFSLSTTSATIGLNGTYEDPRELKTMYGYDFKKIVNEKAPWLATSVKIPATSVSPDPKVCATKSGIYQLKYKMTPNGWDNGVYSLDFTLTVDGIPPTITPEAVERTSPIDGSATFTSSESGKYYYIIQEKDNPAPTTTSVIQTGKESPLSENENKIISNTLSNSMEKVVYIVAKDQYDNYTEIVKMTIPPWKWTLGVSFAPVSGGSISLNSAMFTDQDITEKFVSGAAVKLEAKPDSGYVFKEWINGDNGTFTTNTGTKTIFTMTDKDTNVIAQFEKLQVKGGKVYKDLNGNGQYDKNIDKLYKSADNISVDLYAKDGSGWKSIAKAKVDDQGTYIFSGITAGSYMVKPIVPNQYQTKNSKEFNVSAGSHKNIAEDLGVQAESSLSVEFYNHNNSKVGSSIEVFGRNNGFLKDYTKKVDVKAVLSKAGSGKLQIPVPEYEHYTVNGSNTQTADFDFDDPRTFKQTKRFKLQGNKYTVTFDGNNATKDAEPGTMSVTYPVKNLKKLPGDPEKTQHKFNGWNMNKNGTGSTFSKSQNIDRDITVYAQWKQNVPPVNPPDENEEDIDDPIVPNNNDSNTNSNFEPVDENTPTQNPQVSNNTNRMTDSNVPTFGIGDNKIPLYSSGDAWALVNLILAVAGIITALMMGFVIVYRKSKDDEIIYDEQTESHYKKQRKSRMIFTIGATIMSLGGVLLFMITQDMSLQMVLFDYWTIFNALIFVAEATMIIMVFKNNKEDVDEGDMPDYMN